MDCGQLTDQLIVLCRSCAANTQGTACATNSVYAPHTDCCTQHITANSQPDAFFNISWLKVFTKRYKSPYLFDLWPKNIYSMMLFMCVLYNPWVLGFVSLLDLYCHRPFSRRKSAWICFFLLWRVGNPPHLAVLRGNRVQSQIAGQCH